jgi:glycopeptide antibiotics resistance protein
MIGTESQIPALPVLIPLTIGALAVMVWRLHSRGAITLPRVTAGVAACVYGAGVLKAVLLPFPIVTGHNDIRLGWRVYIHLTPLLTADPIGIVLNVALFLPLGVLLPLVARVSSVRRALLIGFLLSLSIEITQFVAVVTVSSGRVADIDDVLSNCFGTLVGYLLYRLAIRVPAAARLAAAATWPAPRRGE